MKINKFKKNEENDHVFNPVKQIDFKFSKQVLDMFIGYVFCGDPSISRLNLNNLRKLISITNMRTYELDKVMYARMQFLQDALKGKLDNGINNYDILKTFCARENSPECDMILNNIDQYTKLSFDEIKWISTAVSDRLQYSFIVYYKDIIINEFMRIDQGEYNTFKEIVESVKDKVEALTNEIRRVESVNAMNTFSLETDIFDDLIDQTVKEANNPANALVTGIRQLNMMLSPGYMPGRLYMYLGCTGSFKSVILLLSAYWIKKYNRVAPKRRGPNARPVVLYITTENTIQESIIRLFNMAASSFDITNYNSQEVIKLMREKGALTLLDGETDIIMKYYGNYEISTNDLYGIIEDIESDNKEVIALVFDYIKRLRPASYSPEERIQLKNCSNELKDLAIRLKIPVITAQQINRAGNMTIDSAMESGKEDLARFLGRGNIALSWDLLENSDWSCIINPEIERSSGKKYLTFKEIKKRYKSMTDITYFNHPFVEDSAIQLVEDVNLAKSVSKTSLATDLTGITVDDLQIRGKKSAKKREEIKTDFSADFDFSNSI